MLKKLFGKKEKAVPAEEQQLEKAEEVKQAIDYEVQAAISFALHKYMSDLHDYEKTVLTIQKVMRPYSPWSSKIYGLRKYPR